MPFARPFNIPMPQWLGTLLLAFLGAQACLWANTPIPWMLGPLIVTATASMAKYWCSDLQCKVMDECVQLHGGYGYMWEYPITRAYADARVQRIYGGTNEIMKEVISRSMGLAGR